VADEERGTILKVEDPLRCGNIVRKRGFGFLHHGDFEAVLDKDFIDGFPARRVHPGAMHQYDVLERSGTRRDYRRGKAESGQGGQTGFEVFHVHRFQLVGDKCFTVGDSLKYFSKRTYFRFRTLPTEIDDATDGASHRTVRNRRRPGSTSCRGDERCRWRG
jgi:hypothetical protein